MVKCLRFPVTDEACKFKHVLISTVELLFEPLFEDVSGNSTDVVNSIMGQPMQ